MRGGKQKHIDSIPPQQLLFAPCLGKRRGVQTNGEGTAACLLESENVSSHRPLGGSHNTWGGHCDLFSSAPSFAKTRVSILCCSCCSGVKSWESWKLLMSSQRSGLQVKIVLWIKLVCQTISARGKNLLKRLIKTGKTWTWMYLYPTHA